MRKIFSTLVAVALLGGVITVASAQDRRRDNRLEPASARELAEADRQLNRIFQRRIVEARADDRNDGRVRGWYSQEAALRGSERAWMAFRDAECRYLTQRHIGARNRTALLRGCLVEMTQARTDDLRNAEAVLSAR